MNHASRVGGRKFTKIGKSNCVFISKYFKKKRCMISLAYTAPSQSTFTQNAQGNIGGENLVGSYHLTGKTF